ncbi:hypothetical protein OB905_11775 [Halobacteria archaeon AArc-dxtr1]|nr:hypothetical protein [Halobacteria archaeon AArc-dxtr1]
MSYPLIQPYGDTGTEEGSSGGTGAPTTTDPICKDDLVLYLTIANLTLVIINVWLTARQGR